MKNFEDFLANEHAQQYTGLDDMMPDDFNDWLANLGVDELIEYADEALRANTKGIVGIIEKHRGNSVLNLYDELISKIKP